MCTFNGEKHLEQQLQSFCGQTRLPDELIVCDDTSADSTREILTAFKQSAPFPVELFFNQENLGLVANFDKAISLCKGDIICLSDQDDVWEDDKLLLIEQAFDADEKIGMVYSDAKVVDENLADTGSTLWQCLIGAKGDFIKDLKEGKAFDLLLNDGYFLGACMAFRTKYRKLFSPLPLDVYFVHDNWIALVVASVAEIGLIEKPLLKYRQHQQQTSAGVTSAKTPFAQNIVESARRKNDHQIVAEQLKLLNERLENASEGSEANRAKLAAAIRHKEGRANLPAGIFSRAGYVYREFSARNYHLYSNGFKSAIKDIFESK
jgi:glycosyltransferase involved in cell wall biosynthesis